MCGLTDDGTGCHTGIAGLNHSTADALITFRRWTGDDRRTQRPEDPMSDQTPLPKEEDLKRLPLLAIVAYTVRCAMRVPVGRYCLGVENLHLAADHVGIRR